MNRLNHRWSSSSGYSLLELVFATGIAATLSAIGIAQVGNVRSVLKGDAAMRIVISQLNQARETAITQRHYVQITFDTSKNQVSTVREDDTSHTTTLSTISFEGGASFRLVPGLPDTPDAFGKTYATIFTSSLGPFQSLTGTTTVAKFAPDGSLVDWNGHTANGTIFMALTTGGMSARAATVLGSTGRIRGYRWVGNGWVKV